MDIVIRPRVDAASVLAVVRQKVRAMDPELPLSNVRPMREWVSASAAQPRLNAALIGTFACVALLVAAIGIYGVLAYAVSRRAKELGVRMALGADRRGVVGLIVREGMTLGAYGIAAGVLVAALASQALASLVFGVSVRDPLVYGAVALLLGALTLMSCVIPAVRASRVDPMTALRLD
jgi:putative ABC transport system permease protein